MNKPLTIEPIGYIATPYQEKFAIPRQPGLVSSAIGCITLTSKQNQQQMVRGLSDFSHLWLLFIFHQTQQQGWKPLVRPPRLGGNKKIGVLATRSTFRPNPLGMSVVKLEKIITVDNKVNIYVSGVDLLNNSPIVDIKPYVPYSDIVQDASGSFAQTAPDNMLEVTYTAKAYQQVSHYQQQYDDLCTLIEQVLAQDPRPAYKKTMEDNNEYGMSLYHLNIKWRMVSNTKVEVFALSEGST